MKKIAGAVKGGKELGGVLLWSPSDTLCLQLQVFGTAATSNPTQCPHPAPCPVSKAGKGQKFPKENNLVVVMHNLAAIWNFTRREPLFLVVCLALLLFPCLCV